MKKIPFNLSWERTSCIDSEGISNKTTETVNLPDDYIINSVRSADAAGGAFSGYYRGGSAIYRKSFELPEEWREKTVMLNVDGAYQTSEVVVNTEHISFNAYGYSPYCVNITEWLKDSNIIEIETENHQPNSRWYSGGGVYRQVHMLIGGKYYIHPWSVFVNASEITENNAVIKIQFEVTNTTIYNANLGISFAIKYNDEIIVQEETDIYAFANTETSAYALIDISEPQLWDCDNPRMYEAVISVKEKDEIADTHIQPFGIRRIDFSARSGMRLNGIPIKLRGGCIHHEHAALGAAAYPAAEERKLKILKELGYNAIRTAHNPPSESFLRLCDKMGMLVLEESFDCWLSSKTGNDYSRHFRNCWDRDLTSMVKRDRNHPCVFAWSIGNEIKDVEGSRIGVKITKQLASHVHRLDGTRPVTLGQHGIVNYERAGLNNDNFDFSKLQGTFWETPGEIDGTDVWGKQTADHFAWLDIAGYNYMYPRYKKDAVRYPYRIIVATETHPFNMYDYWNACLGAPNCIGDFIWTAYDNLGEAGTGRVTYDEEDKAFLGDFPWLSNSQGDCDLDGNRRPQSYYHKILWGFDNDIHLFSYNPEHYGKYSRGTGWHWNDVSREWTFDDKYVGKNVTVEAYADCDEVEFILNGKSAGRVKPQKYIARTDIVYEYGRIEAVAYKNGSEVSRDFLETTGSPAEIVLIPEKNEITADGLDIAFIRIEVRDEYGRLVTNAQNEIAVECKNARLWLGSGNPCTDENYGTGKRRMWQGKALAAVGATCEKGDIEFVASANGMTKKNAIIKSI